MLSAKDVVIAALNKFGWTICAQQDWSTQTLDWLDSLGFMVVLADVQSALDLDLTPGEYMRLFDCRDVGAVVGALEQFAETR
jgi:hypothetical protein